MSAEHLNTTQPQASAPEHAAQAPNKGRRKAVLIAALAVVALVGAGLTAAFTVRDVTTQNVVTFGSVTMRTIEQEERAGVLVDVPEGYEVKAATGLASRVVSFQNVGSSDMYVRARPHMQAISETGENRDGADTVTTFHMDATGAWKQGTDGWWYYVGGENNDGRVSAATDGSGAGETTDALMTGVEFEGDFYDVAGANGKFVFTVEAQAVQADNNGESALEATGWPAEGAQE